MTDDGDVTAVHAVVTPLTKTQHQDTLLAANYFARGGKSYLFVACTGNVQIKAARRLIVEYPRRSSVAS